MVEKFKNKYRIPSSRLPDWDYGSNAAYFITICAKDHNCFFGNIAAGKMSLNTAGLKTERIWQEIPANFPFAALGVSIIMPNHMHGIILINKPPTVETRFIASPTASDQNIASPTTSGQPPKATASKGGITGVSNPMLHENISRIIRWFKGRTTFEIRKHQPDFAWQPRFYDHIIRDENAFERIQDYILTNPANWKGDKFYR